MSEPLDGMLIPCTWCEREDQITCPECYGTGYVTAPLKVEE